VAAVLLETFFTPISMTTFSGLTASAATRVRPSEKLIRGYEKIGLGAVLDLPILEVQFGIGQTHYLMMGAYHLQPMAACYNSFPSPLLPEVRFLADRLVKSPGAVESLYALGFRTLVFHDEAYFPILGKPALKRLRQLTRDSPANGRLVVIGETDEHHFFALESDAPVDESLAALAKGVARADVEEVGSGDPVKITFASGTDAAYRHPPPLAPTAVEVRWFDSGGDLVQTVNRQVMLPLVLARGQESRPVLEVEAPLQTGDYSVTVAPVDSPDLIIARRLLRVRAPAPQASATVIPP